MHLKCVKKLPKIECAQKIKKYNDKISKLKSKRQKMSIFFT